MNKKQWQKPELVVLVRTKPEEAVLTGCKLVDPGTGPQNFANDCAMTTCEQFCIGIGVS